MQDMIEKTSKATPASPGSPVMSRVVEQLRSMLRLMPGADGGFQAVLDVDSGLSIFSDHFRDGPVLPGICLVQAVLLGVAGCSNATKAKLCELKNAKFLRAVVPGDHVDIDAQVSAQPDGTINVKASLTVKDQRVAQISLVACIDPVVDTADQ